VRPREAGLPGKSSRLERGRPAGAGSKAARLPREAARSRRPGELRSPGRSGRPSWRPRASFVREAGVRNRKEGRVLRAAPEAQPRRSYHVRPEKVLLLLLFITGLGHSISFPTRGLPASLSHLSQSPASRLCLRRLRIAFLPSYQNAAALTATLGKVPGDPACTATYSRLHPPARLHSRKTVTPGFPWHHVTARAVPPQWTPSRPHKSGFGRPCSTK